MEQSTAKRNRWSLSWIVLELAVIVSVFSQIETISRITRPAMYAIWAVVLVMGACKYHGKVPIRRFTQIFIIMFVLFCFYCIFTGLLDSKHFSANYLRVLAVPLIVTIAGDLYSDEEKELFNRLSKVYLICAIVFAFWVHRTYFPSYTSWLSTRIYLFASKNSAGQIWCSAIFISIILTEYSNRFQKYIAYVGCLYLLIMTGMSQCRTAILGICVAIATYAISRSKKKLRWIILIVVIVAIILSVPMTRNFINQALVLNKYAGADLNTFSSGRINRYIKAFGNIASSPFIGIGEYYVDCSYILILAESGLFGLLLIEWVWFKKMKLCFTARVEPRENMFLFIITTYYIVESLLEGYPPFGPGVSSFMFWFLSCVLLNREYRYVAEKQVNLIRRNYVT